MPWSLKIDALDSATYSSATSCSSSQASLCVSWLLPVLLQVHIRWLYFSSRASYSLKEQQLRKTSCLICSCQFICTDLHKLHGVISIFIRYIYLLILCLVAPIIFFKVLLFTATIRYILSHFIWPPNKQFASLPNWKPHTEVAFQF